MKIKEIALPELETELADALKRLEDDKFPGPSKKLFAVRIRPITQRQMRQMIEYLGTTQTELFILAMDRLYRHVFGEESPLSLDSEQGEE